MVVLTSNMHKKAEKPQYQGMIPNAEIFQSDSVARELHWSCELNWGLINHPNTNWTEGGKGELSPYLPYRNGGWPKSCRNFTKFSRRNKYTSQRLHVTSRQDARTLLNVKYKQIQKMKLKREKIWDQYSLKYLSYQAWQVDCSPTKMTCCEWFPIIFSLIFSFSFPNSDNLLLIWYMLVRTMLQRQWACIISHAMSCSGLLHPAHQKYSDTGRISKGL